VGTPQDVIRAGLLDRFSGGYSLGGGARSAGAVITVEVRQADPFDVLYGRGNNDPFWERFPRWINEYRRNTTHRFIPPED
jgi:hypothetical protein